MAKKKKAAARKKPAEVAKKAVKKPVAKKKPAKKAAAKKRPAPKVTKDGGPVSWATLSPYMAVHDAEASAAFYQRAFGFSLMGDMIRDNTGRVVHVGMSLGEAKIMFAPQDTEPVIRAPKATGSTPGLALYVYVPNVDTHATRAVEGGALMQQPPTDQYWRDRTAIFVDPDGHRWTFATHLDK